MIALSKPITHVRRSVSLAGLTSWRVGGEAEYFVSPRSTAELEAALRWNLEHGHSLTVLGAGSNLLVSDRGVPGLVISMRYMRGVRFDEAAGQIHAAAGEPIANIAKQAAARGWSGLEWAIGIPGTVGGLVVMNAGAQGSCAAEHLANVDVLSPHGKAELLLPAQLEFGYRKSIVQSERSPGLVTGATLQLQPGCDPERVIATTSEYLKLRHATQPYNLPSCGSVFRNPPGQSAGWLIEQTGLKGYQISNAQVSKLHANFIVNCGGAKASDILRLIQYVQEMVQQKWAVLLEPEVKAVGSFS